MVIASDLEPADTTLVTPGLNTTLCTIPLQEVRHFQPVAYTENFHGGFGSGSYGGHLYLVFAVYDVTI